MILNPWLHKELFHYIWAFTIIFCHQPSVEEAWTITQLIKIIKLRYLFFTILLMSIKWNELSYSDRYPLPLRIPECNLGAWWNPFCPDKGSLVPEQICSDCELPTWAPSSLLCCCYNFYILHTQIYNWIFPKISIPHGCWPIMDCTFQNQVGQRFLA